MESNGNNSESDSATPHNATEQPGESICDIESVMGEYHDELRKKIKDAKNWAVTGERTFHDFKQFAKFPQDIRLKIWAIATDDEDRRVVTIYVEDGKLRCDITTPRVIHTCSESRKTALESYHRIELGGPNNVCFINFDKEWVFFDTSIALFRFFDANPKTPIFQEKCRMLVLQNRPLCIFGAKLLGKFAELKQLAVVNKGGGYEPDGGGCGRYVSKFKPTPEGPPYDWAVESSRSDLKEIAVEIGVQRYGIVDVQIEPSPAMMNKSDKERARQRRENERKLVAPIRADEDMAFRMQWEFDVRKVEVEVEETLNVDEKEDEFGLAFGLDHGVFEEDFMIYDGEQDD